MENQRFDELTKRFAVRRNRRSVLKGIAGGMAAGIGATALQQSGAFAQTSCEGDGECAEDEICCVGTCRAIECCIDEEDPNARCPEGTSCFEGICQETNGSTGCASDDECAADEICCVGTCRAIECCIDEEDPNARCAEGTTCFEGICQESGVGTEGGDQNGGNEGTGGTAQLPSTGTGSQTGSSSAQFAAVLATGAAAAAFAGRKLRRSSVEAD